MCHPVVVHIFLPRTRHSMTNTSKGPHFKLGKAFGDMHSCFSIRSWRSCPKVYDGTQLVEHANLPSLRVHRTFLVCNLTAHSPGSTPHSKLTERLAVLDAHLGRPEREGRHATADVWALTVIYHRRGSFGRKRAEGPSLQRLKKAERSAALRCTAGLALCDQETAFFLSYWKETLKRRQGRSCFGAHSLFRTKPTSGTYIRDTKTPSFPIPGKKLVNMSSFGCVYEPMKQLPRKPS